MVQRTNNVVLGQDLDSNGVATHVPRTSRQLTPRVWPDITVSAGSSGRRGEDETSLGYGRAQPAASIFRKAVDRPTHKLKGSPMGRDGIILLTPGKVHRSGPDRQELGEAKGMGLLLCR